MLERTDVGPWLRDCVLCPLPALPARDAEAVGRHVEQGLAVKARQQHGHSEARGALVALDDREAVQVLQRHPALAASAPAQRRRVHLAALVALHARAAVREVVLHPAARARLLAV